MGEAIPQAAHTTLPVFLPVPPDRTGVTSLAHVFHLSPEISFRIQFKRWPLQYLHFVVLFVITLSYA